jgi:hypothetical protein
MKWVLRIGLLVVLLAVVALVAAVLMIDSIATATVQKGAAFATQTEVECEKVDVSLFGASATITNLDIKNPEGEYRKKYDSFMKLGDGSAAVSAGSVMSDLIEIPEVNISNIELSLVGLEDGTKNYEVILDALKRLQGDGPPPEETKSEKKVVIRKLTISNITVHYDFAKDPALGAVPAKGTIVLADKEPMVLTDVGAGGVPMSAMMAEIITDVMVQVTANLAGDLGGHMKGLADSIIGTIGAGEFGETLGELGLGDSLEALGGLGIDLGDGVLEGSGDLIEGAGGALKGLLNGDKKDKEAEEDAEQDKEDKDKGVLDDLNPF